MNHPQIRAERKTMVAFRPRNVIDEIVYRNNEIFASAKKKPVNPDLVFRRMAALEIPEFVPPCRVNPQRKLLTSVGRRIAV